MAFATRRVSAFSPTSTHVGLAGYIKGVNFVMQIFQMNCYYYRYHINEKHSTQFSYAPCAPQALADGLPELVMYPQLCCHHYRRGDRQPIMRDVMASPHLVVRISRSD